MTIITAVPGWVWAALAVAVVVAVEFVLWCACVLSSRASRMEEASSVDATTGTTRVYTFDRYPSREDSAAADGADPKPTVGA